ncbi:MAG: sugar phosphate isomerase/epimerase [Bryobacteraceae bacterium]|nr:sugar phosphate isomerase/epimerase [Bryobacteraceae bacterium]
MFSRRQFLAAPAFAIPALAAGNKIDISRISAISDEIANDLDGAIAFAHQYGMKWLELRDVSRGSSEGHFVSKDEAYLKAAARKIQDAGLRVSFFDTPYFKSTLPGTEPVFRRPESAEAREKRLARDQKQFDDRRRLIETGIRKAQILGVDRIRIFSFLRTAEPEKAFPQIADVIGDLAKIAEREKVHLLVENENACNAVTCAEIAALLKMIPSKYVGINWDAQNGGDFKEEPHPLGYSLLPKSRLRNVQIKGRSLLDYPQKLDWKAIFASLERDGYAGQVGLETHIFGPQLIEHSHTCLRTLKQMLS